MVNTILIDIHKNYIVMNNSRVYAVISIFQRSLARQSRCFRLKVRGERLKAGSSYRFALNFVLCCRPRAGCAIVVIVIIVALAGLVVLGGGAGFSRRTTAEMHPMMLASSGTPSTQPVAVALALLAAILGKYAETEQTTKNSRRNREAIQPMADSRGCLF